MIDLCPPAIIYLIFSLVQIILDTLKGLYNTAIMKSVVMILVTFLLNLLCKGGLSIISWIIVFIPFILMTVIVTMLLYIFGLDAASGSINYTCKDDENKTYVTSDVTSNVNTSSSVIIRKPYPHNPYTSYNQVDTNLPPTADEVNNYNSVNTKSPPSSYSSSPEYESFM